MLTIILPLLLFSSHFSYGKCSPLSDSLAPALYVFGDSLVDSGNNNDLHTLAKADYVPYGIDFPMNFTGRFTNNKTVADFVAEHLQLPYAPAYYDKSTTAKTVTTGYNYASASCGVLPYSGRVIGDCLSMNDQLNLFKRTIQKTLTPAFQHDKTKLQQYLAKSIFVVCIGSNDYLVNYFRDGSPTSGLSPEDFAQLLIDGLKSNLTELYSLGARKAVLVELGPLGCMPYATHDIVDAGDGVCNETRNDAAKLYNTKLPGMVADLQADMKDYYFTIAHIYNVSYDMYENHNQYGIVNITGSCCPSNRNGTGTCLKDQSVCDNRSEFYFFDGFHPTERVYSVMAEKCITDNTFCIPMTIDQLVNVDVNSTAALHSAI